MQTTPKANRLHLTLYGRCNSGKSTLINTFTGQDIAIVSPIAGTTTDPIAKAIELPDLGACVITDTAGYDDQTGELGTQRVARSLKSMDATDIALVLVPYWVVEQDLSLAPERTWLGELQARKIPTLLILSQADQADQAESLRGHLAQQLAHPLHHTLAISGRTGMGLEAMRDLLPRLLPADYSTQTITRGLVQAGDTVLLVMPQDQSAPKGRLILPQVQTLRELLDLGCIGITCTPERLPDALGSLTQAPRLIITDSQAFAAVYPHKPQESLLTSFSVLFAAYKGDIERFVAGARALDSLKDGARILIAEACTHAPANEDIGRVKIPALLRKRYGQGLVIDIASGADYPEDLGSYDLIIHCGACMFSRAHVLRRVARASEQQIPITNYGICLAYLTGILDKISY